MVLMAWWRSASAPHATAEIPTLCNIFPTILTRSSNECFAAVFRSIRTFESVDVCVDILGAKVVRGGGLRRPHGSNR